MPVTTYTVLDGEILSENRNGTQRQYVPDPQGNTIALLDTSTTIVKEFSYWSYGGLKSGDADATKYRFGGTYGGRSQWDGGIYFRNRVVDPEDGRWLTVDLLWPRESAYEFVLNNPATLTDGSGFGVLWCKRPLYGLSECFTTVTSHWWLETTSCGTVAHGGGSFSNEVGKFFARTICIEIRATAANEKCICYMHRKMTGGSDRSSPPWKACGRYWDRCMHIGHCQDYISCILEKCKMAGIGPGINPGPWPGQELIRPLPGPLILPLPGEGIA